MKFSNEFYSLEGKYAVISGGTQGLGEATARLFASRKLSGLVIAGRSKEKGALLANDLTGRGCPTTFVEADIKDVDACRSIIKVAESTYGALHILVNVAALTARGSVWDTTPELFDSMLQVNVRAPFFLIQEAAKLMQRNGDAGSIVNISSVAAHGSTPFLTPYAISKGGLNILTKNAAYALMRYRIRVNALNIGWMNTANEDSVQRRYHSEGEDWLTEAESSRPFGRLVDPEEVARAIAYLASEESGLMTGSLIDFDQSVVGAGDVPVPPPVDTWPKVEGISTGNGTNKASH